MHTNTKRLRCDAKKIQIRISCVIKYRKHFEGWIGNEMKKKYTKSPTHQPIFYRNRQKPNANMNLSKMNHYPMDWFEYCIAHCLRKKKRKWNAAKDTHRSYYFLLFLFGKPFRIYIWLVVSLSLSFDFFIIKRLICVICCVHLSFFQNNC